MRFAVCTLLVALLAACAMAVEQELQPVIVSYSKETPWSVVNDAIKEIEKAGGKITHKYNIIKGFAAHAPPQVLQKVEALNVKYPAVIEEDGVVHTLKPGKEDKGKGEMHIGF